MKRAKSLAEHLGLSRRVNSSNLRQVILEEIRSVMAEDASPKDVDDSRFPLPLSQVAADKDKAAALVGSGKDEVDGGKADDVIGVGGASFAVQDLKPSQSSMNIQKAMGMALGMIAKDKAGGDLGTFISSDKHIMDGHHRWVATAMVDPSAQIGGYSVEFPADKLIPVLNALTVGKFGITQGKQGTGGFDQFKEGPIRAQLEDYLANGNEYMSAEEMRAAIEKFTEKTGQEAVDAAVDKFVTNLGTISFDLPKGAPPRPDMPVIDEPNVPAAVSSLSAGEVDVNEPYGWEEGKEKEATTAEAKTDQLEDDVILERWRKMAGLLNG
mgnify:CR=1 FL=1|tara:strand:+ start:217 stop:1191 length:975 start_codon:yes stop_codon:yes gene_type:complete